MTRTAVLLTAPALALGLTACTGSEAPAETGGSAEATGDAAPVTLCDARTQLDELTSQLNELNPTQLDEARASLEELTTTLENVDPPAEVADSVETVRTQLAALGDAVNRAVENPLDADAVQEASAAIQSMSEQTFTDATNKLQEYTDANC